MYNKLVFVALLAAFIYSVQSYNTSCLDPNGNPVAWFLVMKYPGNLTTNPRIAYIDSNSQDGTFTFYNTYADSYKGALENTIYMINQIESQDVNLMLWNDEPPNSPWSPTGAHSKGILAFSNYTQQGVYILHSAPKFPNNTNAGYVNYSLPSNTRVYGQHFYCSSFQAKVLPSLIQNLQVIQPVTYYTSGMFAKINWASSSPLQINSWPLSNGDVHTMFSKNPNFTPYLYENIMQPYLGCDLYTETWGRPYLPNLCSPEGETSTININLIKFSNGDSWDHYSDHSKWAVTTGTNNPQLSCLCDMNRQETQNVRGGSCLCNNNAKLFKALNSIIAGTDSCN